MRLNRREIVRLGISAGVAVAMGRDVLSATGVAVQSGPLAKAIPSSGEKVPAVGLGTASTFSAAARSPEEHTALGEVLREFTRLGGSVIDTSPSYGRSEETIGELVRAIGNADRIFMATKISGADGRDEGMRQFERSAARLAPGDIDLNQVHNLGDWQTQLPLLRELKQAGRIRYLGVTVSSPRRYDELERIMRAEPLDFVQLDYAIDNRDVEQTLLPLAMDRGMATLINGPLGRSSLFRRTGDSALPEWAAEFGATSWARFFLKWLLGSPAVTVVIPATSDPGHLRDNMGAGLGRVPTADERARMAALIDSLPGG